VEGMQYADRTLKIEAVSRKLCEVYRVEVRLLSNQMGHLPALVSNDYLIVWTVVGSHWSGTVRLWLARRSSAFFLVLRKDLVKIGGVLILEKYQTFSTAQPKPRNLL
jgi:hypothetical protein